jgi:hypothetical protein
MAENKAFSILKKLKAVFDGMDPNLGAPSGGVPSNAPATSPASPNGNAAKTAQYNVDGGQPVFVNISDDGVSDIDQNDAVFTDAAMTTPYPDGTYKVTGTDFSFTVAGGVVTAIDDKDGKGAGTPVQSAPASNPAPATQSIPQFKSQDEFNKFAEKFASGTPSPDDMWAMVQALFENVFGWQINQKKAQDAIDLYEENFRAQEKVISEQKEKLAKQEEILRDMFSVVEEIAKLPADNPVEQPKKQHVFSRPAPDEKEKRVAEIASAFNNIKIKANAKP